MVLDVQKLYPNLWAEQSNHHTNDLKPLGEYIPASNSYFHERRESNKSKRTGMHVNHDHCENKRDQRVKQLSKCNSVRDVSKPKRTVRSSSVNQLTTLPRDPSLQEKSNQTKRNSLSTTMRKEKSSNSLEIQSKKREEIQKLQALTKTTTTTTTTTLKNEKYSTKDLSNVKVQRHITSLSSRITNNTLPKKSQSEKLLGSIQLDFKEGEKKIDLVELFLTEMSNAQVEKQTKEILVKRVAVSIARGIHHTLVSGNVQAAHRCFLDALPSSVQLRDYSCTSFLCHNIGNLYKDMGNIEKSLHYQQKSLELAQNIEDMKLEGRAEKGIGVAYLALHEFNLALNHQTKALSLAIATGDKELEARCNANVGNVMGLMGRYRDALNHHKRDLLLCEQLNCRLGMARANKNLSQIYDCLASPQQANEHLQIANDLSKDAGIHNLQFHIHNSMGNLFMQITTPTTEILQAIVGQLELLVNAS